MPRISSAMSGFFFCGIMDEPVVNASESLTNLNSQEDHSTSSSESLLRCIISIASADKSSRQKSLSETPSMLLSAISSKPKSFASMRRSVS